MWKRKCSRSEQRVDSLCYIIISHFVLVLCWMWHFNKLDDDDCAQSTVAAVATIAAAATKLAGTCHAWRLPSDCPTLVRVTQNIADGCCCGSDSMTLAFSVPAVSLSNLACSFVEAPEYVPTNFFRDFFLHIHKFWTISVFYKLCRFSHACVDSR